ncbi:MAG: hypothetical protein U9O98_10460, partial [Asgard group archaeon]|nr:hypothetical protein [Asgard group archaeon]
TFNQSAAIIGPVLMGIIFDIAEARIGLGMYKFLYPFALACVVVAVIFLIFVKGGEASDEKEEKEEAT